MISFLRTRKTELLRLLQNNIHSQESLQLSASSSSSLPAKAYFNNHHISGDNEEDRHESQKTYTGRRITTCLMQYQQQRERKREGGRDLANCVCFLQDGSNLQVCSWTLNVGSCHGCRFQLEGLGKCRNYSKYNITFHRREQATIGNA